jgi:hypothetical protein
MVSLIIQVASNQFVNLMIQMKIANLYLVFVFILILLKFMPFIIHLNLIFANYFQALNLLSLKCFCLFLIFDFQQFFTSFRYSFIVYQYSLLQVQIFR